MNENDDYSDDRPGRGALYTAVLAVIIVIVFDAIGLWGIFNDKNGWNEFIRQHYAALTGLPCAALGSFVIIVFLKQTNKGPLEFEAPDFKFTGASGPVVLWAMCYLIIAITIKMLWNA